MPLYLHGLKNGKQHQNLMFEVQINQNHLLFVSPPGRQTTDMYMLGPVLECKILGQTSGHFPAVFVETEAGYLSLNTIFSLCAESYPDDEHGVTNTTRNILYSPPPSFLQHPFPDDA